MHNKITINLYYGPKDKEINRQINLDKNMRFIKLIIQLKKLWIWLKKII